MNGDKAFVDANFLVYGHDVDSGPKHQIARRILLDLWQQKKGVRSGQFERSQGGSLPAVLLGA
jgi:predicted nucleic acid-binding protein